MMHEYYDKRIKQTRPQISHGPAWIRDIETPVVNS